jgi:ribosomal protein L37AE/L43A
VVKMVETKQKYQCRVCGEITISEIGWKSVPCKKCAGPAKNMGLEGRVTMRTTPPPHQDKE